MPGRSFNIPWQYYDHPFPWIGAIFGVAVVCAVLMWMAPDIKKTIVATAVLGIVTFYVVVTIRFW